MGQDVKINVRETEIERNARQCNRGVIRAVAPPNTPPPPLQSLAFDEFGYDHFKELLDAKPAEFKRRVVDLLFVLVCDVGAVHNDLSLLLADQRRHHGGDIPHNRTCREYDHFARRRIDQCLVVRKWRRAKEGK